MHLRYSSAPLVTSLTENIEVRLCQDQHSDKDGEGVYLTYLDLYVY